MSRIFTLIAFFGVLFGLNCYGQNPPAQQNPRAPAPPTPDYPVFSYNSLNNNFPVNSPIPALYPTAMSNMPTGTAFAINPALPDGLFFETTTGVIHGTPTGISSANYAITATNPSKLSNICLIRITVVPSQPGISYVRYNTFIVGVQIGSSADKNANRQGTPQASQSLFDKLFTGYHDIDVYNRLGIPVPALIPHIAPGAATPVGYTINPALPAGLNFNIGTGEITGTPTTVSTTTKYTVTAFYQFAPSSTFDLNIAVITNPDIDPTDASIEFVGQGDIQQSINTGSKIAANTGLGVIYRENSNRHYGLLHNIEVDFSINVASTVDTVKSNFDNNSKKLANPSAFGNSLLLPLNSGQAFSFSLIGYLTKKGGTDGNYYRNAAPKPLGGVISGFRVDIAGSNRNWELDTIPSAGTTRGNIIKSSMLSTYVGVFYEFITPTAKNNFGQNASATFGFGLSGRWLLGDAAQGNNPQQFLGTTAKITSFIGPEIQLGLRFYNIKAAVHIPMLPSKANNPIPGLTGTQPTTFIGFSGGFPIDLTKRPAATTP